GADDLDQLAVADVDHAYAETIRVGMFFDRDHRCNDKGLEETCLVLDVLDFKPDHGELVDDLGQRCVGFEMLFEPGQGEFHCAPPLALARCLLPWGGGLGRGACSRAALMIACDTRSRSCIIQVFQNRRTRWRVEASNRSRSAPHFDSAFWPPSISVTSRCP